VIRNIGYAFLCTIVLPLWPGIALAQGPENLQRLLKGEYRVATQESCIQSISGFSDAPIWYPCVDWGPSGPGPGCVPPVQYDVTVTGLYSFDGKGNAHSTFKSLVVVDSFYHIHEYVDPPFEGPPIFPNFFLSGSEGECDHSYDVKPDGTFTMQLIGCTGTQVVGGETGLPLYIAGGAESEGFITQGRQTLVMTTVEPAEQTIKVGTETSTRVCMNTTHFYRIWPNKGAKTDNQLPEGADDSDRQ